MNKKLQIGDIILIEKYTHHEKEHGPCLFMITNAEPGQMFDHIYEIITNPLVLNPSENEFQDPMLINLAPEFLSLNSQYYNLPHECINTGTKHYFHKLTTQYHKVGYISQEGLLEIKNTLENQLTLNKQLGPLHIFENDYSKLFHIIPRSRKGFEIMKNLPENSFLKTWMFIFCKTDNTPSLFIEQKPEMIEFYENAPPKEFQKWWFRQLYIARYGRQPGEPFEKEPLLTIYNTNREPVYHIENNPIGRQIIKQITPPDHPCLFVFCNIHGVPTNFAHDTPELRRKLLNRTNSVFLVGQNTYQTNAKSITNKVTF